VLSGEGANAKNDSESENDEEKEEQEQELFAPPKTPTYKPRSPPELRRQPLELNWTSTPRAQQTPPGTKRKRKSKTPDVRQKKINQFFCSQP
jgi:hypothetical protein